MVSISFLAKPIVGKLVGLISGTFIEKCKIKSKLKKIKNFQQKYDDTFVDSNVFQKFLNDEKNGLFIFNYVFGATNNSITKTAFIDQLSKLAISEINIYRKSVRLKEIESHPLVEDYLNDLITYLEEHRDKSFKSNEMSIISNIQNSIVENNKHLQKYIEKNILDIQERAYLEKFKDEELKQILNQSILDLGKRYISEANVETDYNLIFKSLVYDEEIFEQFSNLLEKLQMSIMTFSEFFNKHRAEFGYENKKFIEKILSYLIAVDCRDKEFYLDASLKSLLEELDNFLLEMNDFRYKVYEKDNINARKEINNIVKKINSYKIELDNFIKNAKLTLINEPYLLIYGDAGIGKSHLLADNAKKLQDDGHNVFLFLGQHLNSRNHPFEQIFKLINYKGSKEAFLKEFNDRAINKNKRTIIFIDALNEGAGKYFWRDYLLNFMNSIKHYENIAVVLSVRSNYVRSILPENFEEDFPLNKLEHMGFKDLSLEALEPFFNYYKINPITFPSLENECYNPLFLQIYCEGIQEKYIGYRGWSIVELLEKYIEKINNRLSIDQRFSYSHSLNLVDKILKEIAIKLIDNRSQNIKLEQLYEILEKVASPFTTGYRQLVLGLEEENILLIKSISPEESFVYFTYERFADIYISLVILDKYKEDKKIFNQILLADNLFYYGVYESLSIVVPEKLKVEWLDLIKNELITFEVAESFVRGLSWRNVQYINERTFKWIELCLKQDELDLQRIVYENLLKHSYIIESPLNAEYLHNNLYSLTMASRDSSWLISINNNTEIPTRLVDIILKRNLSFNHFNYENFELLSLIYIWMFTSTDLKLRDTSTTSLVKLYINEPSIIIKNVVRFIDINDPYVLERLLASVYGAVLRTNDVPQLGQLVNIIYTKIFDQGEVYPNVLIRDYARSIILFAANKGIIELKHYEKINPPYTSTWYEKKYTLEEVDEKLKEMQQNSREELCGFHTIIKSMTTEYGRGTGAYGDFGRYVFGSALYDWKNQFNDQDLSNIATMRIIDYGYDEKRHGDYDRNIRYYNRYENLVERIGKKYQWIALYEMLARLTDNYPIYKEIPLYTPEYQKYKQIQNNNHLSYMENILKSQSGDEIELLVERNEKNLKKEDHFLGFKKEYYKKYNGPWDPFLRNIDPSLLEYPQKDTRKLDRIKSHLPNNPDKLWALNKEEFHNLYEFIYIEHKGNTYISLAQLLMQSRDNGKKFNDKDEFFIKSKAVLLPNSDKQKYIDLKTKEKGDISVSWANAYSVFAFEHYWHPSFSDMFYKNEFVDIDCEDAIWEYLWESNINFNSGERSSCSYLMPNPKLVNYFKLIQTSEGIWKDSENNLVAFDAEYLGGDSNLLFRTDYFEKYLKENNLSVVWDFYMEKMSERSRKEEWFLCWTDNGTDIKHIILDQYQDLEMKDRY